MHFFTNLCSSFFLRMSNSLYPLAYLANSSFLLAPLEAEGVDGVPPPGLHRLTVEAPLITVSGSSYTKFTADETIFKNCLLLNNFGQTHELRIAYMEGSGPPT